jgi:tellurite resistance protein
MVASLAVGLFFAIPLFTLIFSRLIFEQSLPAPLQPTLLVLVAPPAVGMSAYVATTGEVDLFAKVLYVVTIFLLTVLLGRLRHLPSCCPFKAGWWAVSFPLAACAVAALRFVEAEPGWATESIALLLVALSTVVILWLLGRTLLGIARGELRQLST